MSTSKTYVALLGLTAMVLQITALSTNYWVTKSIGGGISGISANVKANAGLWQVCMKGGGSVGGLTISGGGDCQKMPDPDHGMEAARAFAIMGVLFIFLALSSVYVYPLKQKNQCVLLAAGGVCSLIAMGIFVGKELEGGSPGYSFYLNIAGGVLALIAAYSCNKM